MGIKESVITTQKVEGIIHEYALLFQANVTAYEWVFKNSECLGTVLCKAYDIQSQDLMMCRTFDALLQNEKAMKVVAESEAIMKIIVSSQYIWDKLFKAENIVNIVIHSVKALKIILGSTISLKDIVASEELVFEIIGIPELRSILFTIKNAVKEIANLDVNWDTIYTLMETDKEFLNEIVSTSASINALIELTARFKIMANSRIIMDAIVESQNARTALYNNYSTTQSILAGSSVALSAMRASSRYDTVSNSTPSATTASGTAYSGKAFVLAVRGCYNPIRESNYYGSYVTGNAVETYELTDSNITVNRFASKVMSGSTVSNTTFAKTYHTIFKI